jgi:hypothetical protein
MAGYRGAGAMAAGLVIFGHRRTIFNGCTQSEPTDAS